MRRRAAAVRPRATVSATSSMSFRIPSGSTALPFIPSSMKKKLQTLIANGNKEGSQELLNQLLGYIYFTSNADLRIIKARVNELLVLLSRAAIEGRGGRRPNLLDEQRPDR